MKINSDLGYKPVTFSELTDDDEFWIDVKLVKIMTFLLERIGRCAYVGMLHENKII